MLAAGLRLLAPRGRASPPFLLWMYVTGERARAAIRMIEAWWRSLKHQWLFLHSLDSVTTVRRLVEFYVQEHNRVLPHSAFRGQTPDEMYFGRGEASQQT
jgi:Integrase core domain